MGLRSKRDSEAELVAKARAAKVSMMILIWSSWTAESTDVSKADAMGVTKVITTAVTFVETWNCKNLWTASLTQ